MPLLVVLVASALQTAAGTSTRGAAAALTAASRSASLRSVQEAAAEPPLSGRDGDPTSIAPREARVETLVNLEGEALGAQQRALGVLLKQQAELRGEAQELDNEETEIAAELRAGREEPSFNVFGVDAGMSVLGWFVATSVYVGLIAIVAILYGQFLTYPYVRFHYEDAPFTGEFTFGLFEGIGCDPDWRICFCSCLCLPVRWADTISSRKVQYMGYWPALVAMVLLQSFVSVTFGLAGAVLILMVVNGRQRIREIYGLPYGTVKTQCHDCLVWTFCAPCAAMQEAMEIELINPPQFKADFDMERVPYDAGPRRSMMSTGGAQVPAPQQMSRGGQPRPQAPRVPQIQRWETLSQEGTPQMPTTAPLDPADQYGPVARQDV